MGLEGDFYVLHLSLQFSYSGAKIQKIGESLSTNREKPSSVWKSLPNFVA
jgi:hypothetical protein